MRIYISLAKATKKELGFDPTFTRVITPRKKDDEVDEKFQIAFEGKNVDGEVVSEVWETVRLISNSRADWIVGRASRIWEIRRTQPPPENREDTMILKDLWLDDRVSEGDRYRQIHRWLDKNPRHADKRKHFFTLHAEGAVMSNRKGVKMPVSTFKTLRGDLDLVQGNSLAATVFNVSQEEVYSINTINSISLGATMEVSATKRRALAKPAVNRTHYRLILSEVAKRIDELRDFGSVYESLIGASRGEGFPYCGITH